MRFTSVAVDDMVFGSYGNRVIKVDPIKFQIPRMYMPFGVSGFAPPYGEVKYNIDFSMKGWNEPGNYISKFYDFMTSVESKVIEYVESISVDIFNEYKTKTELRSLFNSNIKVSGTYDPKFRVKVSNKTQFFDIGDSELQIPLEEGLFKRYSGAAFVEMGNIYFFNQRFGITWKMEQIKVYEPQRLHGFNFAEPDEDEEEPTNKITGCQFK